ncbi:MAG: DsrE family protein [bacterium]|nr:DsrE family protein [bacterium]
MVYRAVFHVDANDGQIFGLSLNNAANLLKAIPDDHSDVVMLFNGPAVQMLRQEGNNHADAIRSLQEQRVVFKACRNALSKFGVNAAELVPGCVIIPAGVVELIVLQQDGYAYIKP